MKGLIIGSVEYANTFFPARIFKVCKKDGEIKIKCIGQYSSTVKAYRRIREEAVPEGTTVQRVGKEYFFKCGASAGMLYVCKYSEFSADKVARIYNKGLALIQAA